MSVTSVEKDFDHLTLTVVADFDAPLERVWELWADPRQLERWWGPPMYPATVEEHDLTPGGQVTYSMIGPDGERHRGWWRVTAVEPARSLSFIDGFADENGNPVTDMPTTRVEVRLAERDGGTRMEVRTVFDSREQMQQLIDTGLAEGRAQAIGQMDDVIAGSVTE
jgi:uncharacterized protein YndB with AHSA1/START domain